MDNIRARININRALDRTKQLQKEQIYDVDKNTYFGKHLLMSTSIFWSEERKNIILIELTVPWEEKM